MKIEDIKKEMITFRDFYGCDLLESDCVKKATTKEELASIIENHRNHITMQANDAEKHLDRFAEKLGLYFLD